VLTNDGAGGFAVSATPGVGQKPESVAVADVNGDGRPDLISADQLDDTLTVLTNNGSGGFGFNATLSVGGAPISVIAVDLNADGKRDLVCVNLGNNTLTVLINLTPFPPAPSLGIGSVGSQQTAIFWPAGDTNYVLETSTNLSSPNWTRVTNGAPLIGVVLTNTAPSSFYRLSRP